MKRKQPKGSALTPVKNLRGRPNISILMPVLNMEEFLPQCLRSIQAQTYKDWELVVMDGGSRDGTLDILRKVATQDARVRVYSEPTEGPWHAIWKAAERARGNFFCLMCASDGYVNEHWLSRVAEAFRRERDVSLVWGIPVEMTEDGKILGPSFLYAQFLGAETPVGNFYLVKKFLKRILETNPLDLVKRINRINLASTRSGLVRMKPPQKEDWFSYWLNTGTIFPDLNMCMTRRVFFDCHPPYNVGSQTFDAQMDFYFNFNAKGYLAYCLPILANFGRVHKGQFSNRADVRNFHDTQRSLYAKKIDDFRKNALSTRSEFTFLDRKGNPIRQHP